MTAATPGSPLSTPNATPSNGTPSNTAIPPWRQPDQLTEQEGISPGKLWVIIRRRRLWFGATFGLVLSAVGLVTMTEWLTKPQFRGGFRLMVKDPLAEERQRSSGDLDALARVNTAVNVPNLVEVLASPMLLDPLAKKLGYPPGALQGRVSIQRLGRDTDVLDVSLLWGNPDQGRRIIDALSQEYLAYSLRQRREKLTQGLEYLDEQAPGLQQRVLNLQQELAAFRKANTMLAPEEQSRSLEQSRAGLEGELRSLRQTEAQLLGLLAMVRSGQLVSPFQTPSTPVTGQSNPAGNITNNFGPLLQELVSVEGELSKAQATYSGDSPLVRNLRARRDSLRPLLQRREMEAIQSAIQVNRVQQQQVQRQNDALAAEFRKNPELIKGYEALQQRLNVARANLGSYLEARENFRLEVAQSTMPWKVISPPYFGSIPVEPNLFRRLMQGLGAGLVAGTAVALIRDKADRAFYSRRAVEEALGLPVLAGIPYLPVVSDRPIGEWQKELDAEESFTLRESLRNFYQSLRRLRTSKPLHAIAITSSLAGEGKSTATALLAQSLGEMGMKVLVVDADLRKPRLHRRLGVDGSRGLAELFSTEPPSLASLCQWVNPNLALLPGGQPMTDPARVLSSNRCAEIIHELRSQEQFDLILFDTPPALDLVDPLLIADHMDGLILVVSVGNVNRDLPPQVVNKLKLANVDVLGVVTNQRIELITGYEAALIDGQAYGYLYNESTGEGDEMGKKDSSLVARGMTAVRNTTAWLDGEKPTGKPDDRDT